jgi:hypothetical protein
MSAPGSAREQIAAALERLVEVSAELREAMLARDSERILAAVARGEEVAASAELARVAPRWMADPEIGALARQFRRLQEANHLLASSFVRMFRQILRPADDAAGGAVGLYGRSGTFEAVRSGPMLIRQTG